MKDLIRDIKSEMYDNAGDFYNIVDNYLSIDELDEEMCLIYSPNSYDELDLTDYDEEDLKELLQDLISDGKQIGNLLDRL